jgi:hypothetical protein
MWPCTVIVSSALVAVRHWHQTSVTACEEEEVYRRSSWQLGVTRQLGVARQLLPTTCSHLPSAPPPSHLLLAHSAQNVDTCDRKYVCIYLLGNMYAHTTYMTHKHARTHTNTHAHTHTHWEWQGLNDRVLARQPRQAAQDTLQVQVPQRSRPRAQEKRGERKKKRDGRRVGVHRRAAHPSPTRAYSC